MTNRPTILVTGASGMLGRALCPILEKGGFNVEKERFDICSSAEEVAALGQKLSQIEAIIHCAAATDVSKCEQNKELSFSTNVVGTKNMVDLAKQLNAKLIYISTPMVFSGNEGDYIEQSATNPLNYYAKTKLLAEEEVLKYDKGLVLRVNPIGIRPPGAHPSFIQWFVNAAKNNQSFDLFTDVRINPISTTTLSETISQLISDFQPGILHLGSQDVANKAEIWDLIVAKFPDFNGIVSRTTVDATSAGQIAARPKEMWLNVQKVQKLGYQMPFWRQEVIRVLKALGLNS